MFKNYYTLFVSPPSAGRTRQFHFRKKTLYFLFLLLTIFIIGDYIAIYIAILKYRESTNLKKENTQLKAEKEELEKVAKTVDEIKKNESFIRDFLGLEKSDSSTGGLGMGGATLDFIDPASTISLNAEIPVAPKETEPNLPLTTKALLLKKDLEELVYELIDRKNEWNTKPIIMPIEADEYWISSGFGWRIGPFTSLREFHRGLDISAKRGTPIIAPADGIVEETGTDRQVGRFVTLKHNEKFSTLYGHLLQIEVKKGEEVKRGDVIGLMGNSGMSTGYHLHYEVRKDNVNDNPYNHILNLNTSNTIVALE